MLAWTPVSFLLFPVALGACAYEMRGATYEDERFHYTNVKSFLDNAGGPRQDVIVVTDAEGRIVASFSAAGFGTWQTVTTGLAAAAANAGGSALIRPSQTNVSLTGGADTQVNTVGHK